MTKRKMRDWVGVVALLAVGFVAACGASVQYLQVKAEQELNPGAEGNYRPVTVRVFLLDETNEWEAANSPQLWPSGGSPEVKGCFLYKTFTVAHNIPVEDAFPLSHPEAPNATRVGVTANFTDKSGAWKRSRPIKELKSRAVTLKGIGIGFDGEDPAAIGDAGR